MVILGRGSFVHLTEGSMRLEVSLSYCPHRLNENFTVICACQKQTSTISYHTCNFCLKQKSYHGRLY